MMGFCGLDCSGCRCYRGTLTSDIALLEEVAREWVEPERTHRAVDMMCLGCAQPDSRLLPPYCGTCSVRLCALERKIPTCAACPDFDSCDRFKGLMRFLAEPKVESKMRLMRAKVLEGESR